MSKDDLEEWTRKLKTKFHEQFGTQQELEDWADSVVQSIWRPVALGLTIGLPTLYIVSKYVVGKRFPTAAHIPPETFEKQTKIRGKVVAVGDSDNFRLYHTPGLGWGLVRNIPKTRKELQNQTISIRIAGVDAPEGAHFGMPAQPLSKEAKEFLTKLVLNKRVQVQLLSRDQYSRVVAMAYVRKPPFFIKKNVSIEMLKQGLASIYVAKGAEYSGLLDQMKKSEARAK
jgi:endonuclease YncB( thermonuclease family)